MSSIFEVLTMDDSNIPPTNLKDNGEGSSKRPNMDNGEGTSKRPKTGRNSPINLNDYT